MLVNILCMFLFTAGCNGAVEKEHTGVPAKTHDGWEVASPVRFGANLGLLDTMVSQTKAGEYANIHSILVVKDGVLVLEEYFEGQDRNTPHEIRSATKSIGSVLTGIAIDKGYVTSEYDPIFKYFGKDYEPAGGWNEPLARVEIRHFLSMMSGQDCDDLATNFACENAMYETGDWVQYSLNLPFAYEPGQHWAYNSSSLILVGEAVARGAGIKMDEFAERYLFGPLGIKKFQWNYSPKGRAWIGGGARMIPREMAKIGQLMLNRGVWNGERILSEEWIDKSTRKQGNMLLGVDYGYLWQTAECYFGTDFVRAFWASGNGGQYIIVIPDHGMVVVFTGASFNSPLADQPFLMLTRFIVPAFLHPQRPKTIELTNEEMEGLTGVYCLDFEPSATSTISIHDGAISLLSPENEVIGLTAHSPAFFTGRSRHGPITVVFEGDDAGTAHKHTIYGMFQRFVFIRE